MNAASYSATGTKSQSAASLNPKIFGQELTNTDLIKQSYNAYLANGRANLAVTKTRGLVRGGGRKPWRQKGTGRARFGSSRNPIWRGGGIVFGPTGQENYKININKQAKLLALKQALSLAASSKKLIIIEDLKLKAPKTKQLALLLSKLKTTGRIVLVTDAPNDQLILASRNLPDVQLLTVNSLNVFDILNADNLILTKAALTKLPERLKVT